MDKQPPSKQAQVCELFAKFMAGMRGEEPQKARPMLVAVTACNAHEFTQAPKRRGRKPKVVLGGNVVAFRRPAAKVVPVAAQADTQARMSQIMAPFMDFLDRRAAEREARLKAHPMWADMGPAEERWWRHRLGLPPVSDQLPLPKPRP